MAAISGQLDEYVNGSSRRIKVRRKLRLEAQGATASRQGSVLILDISTLGLLLQTSGDLVVGDVIELELPDTPAISAIVKWTNDGLFGCEFTQPASDAFVSAALLRSIPRPPIPGLVSGPDPDSIFTEVEVGKLSGIVRISLLIALTLPYWTASALLLAKS